MNKKCAPLFLSLRTMDLPFCRLFPAIFYAVRPSKRCFLKISVRKWHILICFLYFCRAFAIKAIADIIKGVNYALYIGHSERRKFKLIINGIAKKMSRVSCIINPRSVPRRAIPQRHTFEAYITFSVRFYLLVNNQWFFLRPRMTDGQV